MTAVAASPGAAPGSGEPRHGLRILLLWALASAVFTPLVYYVWGPHMPPGQMTDAAKSQQWDNAVLATFATPVVTFIYVYFAYAITVFRQRGEELQDGVPVRGSAKLAAMWILATSAIVMFAFAFGTYELVAPAGAGGGEGPSPIWNPSSHNLLQVQVIGQQWSFTYRWPQFGGVETKTLELPVGREVQFNVTSLDVIHSFWAYELGVKADANPQLNDVAYAKPEQTGSFQVRCSELCGIWHGSMFNDGKVVAPDQFMSWITGQESANAATTKLLPPYRLTYEPAKDGAGGSYYNDEPNAP